MNLLLIIFGIILIAIVFSVLSKRIMELRRKEVITTKLLQAVIFALFDKRTDSEEAKRFLTMEEFEEAIKVITAQKRPERDTTYEEMAKILGEDYREWHKQIVWK